MGKNFQRLKKFPWVNWFPWFGPKEIGTCLAQIAKKPKRAKMVPNPFPKKMPKNPESPKEFPCLPKLGINPSSWKIVKENIPRISTTIGDTPLSHQYSSSLFRDALIELAECYKSLVDVAR